MAKQLLVTLLMLLSCSGCTFFCKEIDANPPFSPHHFCYNEVEVNWQAEQGADGVRLSGTVRNLSPRYLQDLELTARLVNEQGRVIARGTAMSFPVYLAPDKPAPFHLDFHLPSGAQVKRVHFSYLFWVSEGGPSFRVYEDAPRFRTFASPL